MRRVWLAIALQLLYTLLPALAREPVTAVVVVEGLTWQDIEQGKIGGLYVMAQYGAVGLMSVGRGDDVRSRFALTLQTGRRLAPPARATPEEIKQRFARLRWMTEDLSRAGVKVSVHSDSPQAPLLSGAEVASPSAHLQIWWVRGDTATINNKLEEAVGSLNPERDRVLIVGLPLEGLPLAPVIAAGSGWSGGLLTSDTTRTPGVISDTDVAPTLLRWHGVAVRAGEHPARVVQVRNAFSDVQRLAQMAMWNASALIPVGVLQVGGGLLAVLSALNRLRVRATSRRAGLLLSVAIGSLLSLPAGTLIAPYIAVGALWQYVLAIVLSAVWLSLLAHWGAWHEPFRAYVRACALSVLVIVVDAITGQHGVRSSLYSAYTLSGIRFYGIGNEVMGVLVGCALVWGMYGLERWVNPSPDLSPKRGEELPPSLAGGRKKQGYPSPDLSPKRGEELPPSLAGKGDGGIGAAVLRALLWTTVAAVLANPAWGANLGGWMTTVVGLGCDWEARRVRGKLLAQRVALWFLIGAVGALLIMWLDSLSASPSHLGEAFVRWRTEGWSALAESAISKLSLMVRVLLSPFAWGVAVVAGVALWAMRRQGVFARLSSNRREELTVWLTCIVAAFVFNDSGFVPALAILGIGVGAMLTRQLEEVSDGASA